jgi:hypothetical protein
MAPGAVSTPPGVDRLPKKRVASRWMLSPWVAASAAAVMGDKPTSGWNRQFMRSWMISAAGTVMSDVMPETLSDASR